MVNGNGRDGYCPHCLGGPELCREAEDAFCLVCGYRLSYYGRTLLPDELTARYDESREIASAMALTIPLHQPGSVRHGFSIPASMSTGG